MNFTYVSVVFHKILGEYTMNFYSYMKFSIKYIKGVHTHIIISLNVVNFLGIPYKGGEVIGLCGIYTNLV